MGLRKFILLFLAAVLSGAGLFAQNSDSQPPAEPQAAGMPTANLPMAGQEFSPFIANLQGEIKNNLLRLTWTDSPSAKGPVYIYRSNSPFEDQAGVSGRPGVVPYGIESYIDELDDPGTYYYLAVASDETGQRYDSYINSGNSVSVNMTGSIELAEMQAQAAAAAAQTAGLCISNIAASAENDKIIISFSSEPDANPVLYRGVRPIRNITDLLGSVIIQNNAVSPFYDTPVPGIPYYYAIVCANDLAQGVVLIQPGVNATAEPAQVSSGKDETAGVRAVPLPLISLSAAMPGGLSPGVSQQPMELSEAASAALESIPVYEKAPVLSMDGMVFPSDLETSGGGEDYLLGSIVQGSFINRDWKNAADELTRFISLPRSTETEARARYYLGQCLYFTDSLNDALYEFLSVRTVYPDAAEDWIQSILLKMAQ